jgi:hypothetical protein
LMPEGGLHAGDRQVFEALARQRLATNRVSPTGRSLYRALVRDELRRASVADVLGRRPEDWDLIVWALMIGDDPQWPGERDQGSTVTLSARDADVARRLLYAHLNGDDPEADRAVEGLVWLEVRVRATGGLRRVFAVCSALTTTARREGCLAHALWRLLDGRVFLALGPGGTPPQDEPARRDRETLRVAAEEAVQAQDHGAQVHGEATLLNLAMEQLQPGGAADLLRVAAALDARDGGQQRVRALRWIVYEDGSERLREGGVMRPEDRDALRASCDAAVAAGQLSAALAGSLQRWVEQQR